MFELYSFNAARRLNQKSTIASSKAFKSTWDE